MSVSRAVRELVIGSVCAAFLILAGVGLHAVSIWRLRSHAKEFEEISHVVDSTPRIAMAVPLAEERQVAKQARRLLVFPSAWKTRDLLDEAIAANMEYQLKFMAEDSTAGSALAKSFDAWRAFEQASGFK